MCSICVLHYVGNLEMGTSAPFSPLESFNTSINSTLSLLPEQLPGYSSGFHRMYSTLFTLFTFTPTTALCLLPVILVLVVALVTLLLLT